jgi:hypothetical protein
MSMCVGQQQGVAVGVWCCQAARQELQQQQKMRSLSLLTASQSHLLPHHHHHHHAPHTLAATYTGGRGQLQTTSKPHLLAFSKAQGVMDMVCRGGQQYSQWLAVAKQQQQQQHLAGHQGVGSTLQVSRVGQLQLLLMQGGSLAPAQHLVLWAACLQLPRLLLQQQQQLKRGLSCSHFRLA